ncbi:MAG: host-nuclease inhibitor Gam family protein [Akkermansia sp.]
MTTTNTRNKPVFANREEFEAKVDEIAILMVKQNKKKAAMDEAMQIAREAYEADIADLETQITQGIAICEPYVFQNRDTLLKGKKKSATTMLAAWSLKKGKEKLGLSDKVTWEAVLDKARKLGMRELIRVKDEADKAALAKLTDAQLASLGVVKIAAVDSFGITPKDNSIDNEN